ncbi:MAG: cell division protein FtsA [Patescibacteria group bacterium]
MNNFITGLDIGSQSVKVVVGEVSRGEMLRVIEVLKFPSAGMRKGVVQDVSDVTQALSPAIAAMKKIGKSANENIFLGMASSDLKVQQSLGVVAVSRADYEIYQDDVNRAIQSAQAVNLAPNRVVLHSIVREYIVDGVRDIRDPLEMTGNRLEVSSLIIDAFGPAVKNLTKCVEILGGSVGGIILGPLANARAVLSKNQRELGVLVVDIGFGKTSMCVYEEGKLLHAAVFPVGSGHATNDLAIGLKVPMETAEIVKLSFGSAIARSVAVREGIELAKIDGRSRGTVQRKFIAEIIEVRLAEIFELINNELKYIGKSAKLPGGIVIVGGGAKLPGIVDLAKQELKLSAQIGIPETHGFDLGNPEIGVKLEDPEFTCALGLVLSGYDKSTASHTVQFPMKGLLRKVFRYFAP